MVKDSRDEARGVARSVSKWTLGLPDMGTQTVNLGDCAIFVKPV